MWPMLLRWWCEVPPHELIAQLAHRWSRHDEPVDVRLLVDDDVTDGARLKKELAVGQDVQHIIEASAPHLCPIVPARSQHAVALL